MIINEKNGSILSNREICMHDDTLEELVFDRQEYELRLSIAKFGCENTVYIVRFCGVVGFEMTSCDFWGASERISDFCYVGQSKRKLLPKLLAMKMEQPNQKGKLSEDTEYMETFMEFISGDRLIIACEHIEIDDDVLQSGILSAEYIFSHEQAKNAGSIFGLC